MLKQTAINPATGALIKEYPAHSEQEVQQAIARGHAALLSWRNVPIAQRAALLLHAAEVIATNKDHYAKLISEEMGKPLKEAIAEVEKCAGAARYFSENGPGFLADKPVVSEYRKSYVTFQPIGIVLGIMPWNFPFWQALRYAFPALLAGNTGILKHASNVPGCALAIASIFKEAGFPDGVFQSLLIPASRIEELVSHPHIAAVTLTGSTPAGKSVAAMAGKYLKKTVLELGGSDPYVILADCDIEHAIKTCAGSRLNNCGQSCVSAKRLIVVPQVRARFEQGVADIFVSQKLGNPLDATTTVGPMSRADLRDELHEQVQRSIKSGARLLVGGTIPTGSGAFYMPTVLTDVSKGMAAYEEELFGPVAVIIPAKDEEDAIRIANDTHFGLGGAVFTQDLARGEQIARDRVQSGLCFVNMMVRSDARLPFGGIKTSGYGRELSAFGIHEFVNIKSIVVA